MPSAPPGLPIADYALIGDCHSAALVSRGGSIDWCCLPEFDSDSCFARLLDPHAGHFRVSPCVPCTTRREYIGDSMVLATTFESEHGALRLVDFFAMRRGGRHHPRRELVRIVEGLRGSTRVGVAFVPRPGFGIVKPWIFPTGARAFAAVGGAAGLLVFGQMPLERAGRHALAAEFDIVEGERRFLAMTFVPPQDLDLSDDRWQPHEHADEEVFAHLDETLDWWHAWASRMPVRAAGSATNVARSALVLKALTYAPTCAIVAAPTTSLPERPGGERNWDYRYSWIRDSVFTVHTLADLGCIAEADGFRRFIQRSAAGNVEGLQVLVGIDGRRRLPEVSLDHLAGWGGSRPVRVGNAADVQFQSDMYGLLLELAWRWSERGNRPDEPYWEFLVEAVDCAADRWRLPDHGIWEIRAAPRHFVHSKVMCWAALERGIALAERHGLPAPLARWRTERDAVRAAIEEHGVDHARGRFVAAFGATDLDAALLLLPDVGFVAYDDARMIATADAIGTELDAGGLIRRYTADDGLRDGEGSFLACSFWLAECWAWQGRLERARRLFERACACANDVGLFSEEYDCAGAQMLGNFPQGLTHLAHISAALALETVTQAAERAAGVPPAPEREAVPTTAPEHDVAPDEPPDRKP